MPTGIDRAARPLAGMLTAAVSAVHGVRAVHLDLSGELLVDIDPREDRARIAAQVRTILSVGLGFDALLMTDSELTVASHEREAPMPLADVIPLPRRADTWPGQVPAIPDLDVTVPWRPGSDTSQDRAIRIISRGHVGPDGRPRVDLTVMPVGSGPADAAHQTVDDAPGQIQRALIELAITVAANNLARVRCVDAQLLDLAGRDAVVVVVVCDGTLDPGLGVTWVDVDSRVAWVMATLEAVSSLVRRVRG